MALADISAKNPFFWRAPLIVLIFLEGVKFGEKKNCQNIGPIVSFSKFTISRIKSLSSS